MKLESMAMMLPMKVDAAFAVIKEVMEACP
jgi:hypothetical protein